MKAEPGPRVRAAFARQGIEIRRATSLPGHGHSTTTRVALADGRVAKLRAFPTSVDARRVEQCLAAAPPGVLPAPLGRAGRWLMTEFIEGMRLDDHWHGAPAGTRSRSLSACARLLARLHGAMAPALQPTPMPVYSRAIARATRGLAHVGAIARGDADRLRALRCPMSPTAGLAHGDPGPDNLVVTPNRRLRFIDEERVAVRPLAYDLARAICRWQLSVPEERRFLAAYDRSGGVSAAFTMHREFWVAAALSTSVTFRLRYGPETAAPAVAALRALASARSAGRNLH